ncbi:MAG: hypothetical protein ACKVZH_14190 [Blastocatellia bacterium]
MNRYRKLNHALFHRKQIGLALFVAMLALAAYPAWRVWAAGGNLDTSFSGDGRYTMPDIQINPESIENFTTRVPSVRIQYDQANPTNEKIIALCNNDLSIGQTGFVRVRRLGVSGLPDSTFGNNGVALFNYPGTITAGGGRVATEMEVQSNGRIIVAGLVDANSEKSALARLTFNGSLDTSFSSNGWVTLGNKTVISGIKLTSDGKILVFGKRREPFPNNLDLFWQSAIWRFNGNGTLDTSFSSDGLQVMDVWSDFPPDTSNGSREGFNSVYVQADGKIVAMSNSSDGYRLRRFTANGAIDSTFTVNASPGEYGYKLHNIGPIFWVIGSKQQAIRNAAIYWHSNNGSRITTSTSSQATEWADISKRVTPNDGTQTLVGYKNYGTFGMPLIKAVIARYFDTGSPDVSFGTNGFTETVGFDNQPGSSSPSSQYYSLDIGLSGKIVVGGDTYFPIRRGIVARYWGD